MNIPLDEQTIIAQCTPTGSGALALIRLSGEDACLIAERMSRLAKSSLSAVPTHTIHYGWIVDEEGTAIDQVLFLVMHAPRTFTGQNTVEITCHNNQFLIQAIIQRALACGARPAQEGEFTRRSFMNGKIDLLKAEAINELIHAPNQQALNHAMAQLHGTFSSWVADIEKQLLKSHAYCQASFEFLDEELEFAGTIHDQLKNIYCTIATLIEKFDSNQQIKTGIRIALIGSVNAGKSSLFNALLDKKRAIVSSQPGTTRDSLEGFLSIDSIQTTLIDTAGLRETDDQIEVEGIERSWHEAALADLILLIIDSSRSLTHQEIELYEKIASLHPHKIIPVKTKIDCQAPNTVSLEIPSIIHVSITQPQTISELRNSICKKIDLLFSKNDLPFLLNQRHLRCLIHLKQSLTTMFTLLESTRCPYEILALHLEDALALLSTLTGKTISEHSMDAVFKEFCVGK